MSASRNLLKHKGPIILWSLIFIALLIEIIRDAGRGGDFLGYVNAGNLVWNTQNIYSDPLNTWPPFFSIFSIPLALLDQVNGYVLRLLWLVLSVIAFFDLGNRLFKMVPGLQSLSYKNAYHSIYIIVPFLISFRFLLDNLANIQINIFMLWLVVVAHESMLKNHFTKAGFLLAFSISLKAYTVFLLFFYLYKRIGPMVLWTFLFFVVLNCLPFLVFGYDITIHYYDLWWNEIASGPTFIHHKNQSIFGAIQRLLTNNFPGHHFYVNIVDWTPEMAKKISYIIIFLLALIPAWLFRKKVKQPKLTYEWIFVLTVIPILSPLSWKAYFIFLFPAYLLLFFTLRQVKQKKHKGYKTFLVLYWISVAFTVLSTEAIVGDELSDRLESLSIITCGTLLLLVTFIAIYHSKLKLSSSINHN